MTTMERFSKYKPVETSTPIIHVSQRLNFITTILQIESRHVIMQIYMVNHPRKFALLQGCFQMFCILVE